jgi:glycosyltransferase involved in cell wall biosynthesis
MSQTATLPLVTVGLVVRNCAVPLRRTLRSILMQSYPSWELIVIDDGSSDDTPGVIRTYDDPRIRLVAENTSRGLAARLNEAIALARGKYFARIDGDDVCFPQRFERQVAYLEAHPETDLLGTGGVVFRGDGEILGLRRVPLSHAQICANPWSGFYLAHPSWMGRLDWFRRNRYDERAVKGQDTDLLLRTHANSRFAALPEALIGYREERLSRAKNLATRRHLLASQWRHARRFGGWRRFARSIAEQGAKAVVELVVIGTPLQRRVLKHRALPIDTATAEAWNALWRNLGDDATPMTEAT